MSFGDRPNIPPLKAAGCVLYCFVAGGVVFFFLIAGVMGDCADGPDDSGCKEGFANFLMFPGSLVIAIVIGMFLVRWAMRNENDD